MNVTRPHGVGGLSRTLVALRVVLGSLSVAIPAVVRAKPAAAQTIDLIGVSDSGVSDALARVLSTRRAGSLRCSPQHERGRLRAHDDDREKKRSSVGAFTAVDQ
jgi:hypothetical protein